MLLGEVLLDSLRTINDTVPILIIPMPKRWLPNYIVIVPYATCNRLTRSDVYQEFCKKCDADVVFIKLIDCILVLTNYC